MSNERNMPSYIDEAVFAFEKIMLNGQTSFLGNLMKASKGEIFVLKVLLKSKTPVSPTELSEALRSSKSRISAILHSLEKKGEVRREIDESNRRNILVRITDVGRERIMSEMKDLYGIVAELLLEMGEEDTREFMRLTTKLMDTMQKIENR